MKEREGLRKKEEEEEEEEKRKEGRRKGRERGQEGGRATSLLDPSVCAAWTKNHLSALRPFHYFQLLSHVCFSVVLSE